MPIKIPQFFKKKKDPHLVCMNFIDGCPISKGIPWNEFSEIEIQAILKIHFEELGFNVIWRHKQDASHENGIDLECTRKKDNWVVVIAVKKNPKKEDLGQFIELSQSEADQKIYVYVNGAAQSFRNQIPKFETIVDFWDEHKLEENLTESHITLKLLIDNSHSNYAIQEITKNILQSIRSPSKKFPKPNLKNIMTIWTMKDRAATVNKCAGMLQLMLEDSRRIGDLQPKQVHNLVVWSFDYLYSTSLMGLYDVFDSMPNDLKDSFYHTYDRTRARSNWLELCSYPPRFIPGNLDSLIFKDTPVSDSYSTTCDSAGTIPFEESNFKNTLLDEAANEFRLLSIWGDGLEGTIDYLFEEYISELKL